jgi:metallo-beta-lactamase family protein
MAQKATAIFKTHRELFNSELTQDQLKSDPFSFEGLYTVESHHESLTLFSTPGPKVIIAGSGMMTGGRIVHHAEKLLNVGSTRLLFVGYQAEGTLGRQILEGEKKVKAHIDQDQGLSSHADQPKLLNWLNEIEGVKKVILTHGEDIQRNALKQKIERDLKIGDIVMPVLNQEISLQ